ncbi:MAG: response regulator [Anaerolineae bacterium]|jgi:CheY-like chemotaxis protein/predicted regulator of Ras-like GTPase activity (Roadblock/LC7/MglB family)
MSGRILVVDRNEAFSTMLKGLLEIEGGYEVEAVHSGRGALTRLRQSDYDLTIVDVDLDPVEMNYGDLIGRVRRIRPAMRLMLIPLMGEELPPEASQYDLQGTLSKPFFADDLLPRIKKALAKQVTAPQPIPDASTAAAALAQPAIDPTPGPSPAGDVQGVLADLARETRADVVLLVSTVEGDEQIVAQITALDRLDLAELAALSITTVQTARATAQLLGQPDVPFEHNMFESQSLRLYIMTLPGEVLLVVVAPATTALGTVRHNLRRARRALVGVSLT